MRLFISITFIIGNVHIRDIPLLRTKMVIRLFIAFHVGAKLELGKRL